MCVKGAGKSGQLGPHDLAELLQLGEVPVYLYCAVHVARMGPIAPGHPTHGLAAAHTHRRWGWLRCCRCARAWSTVGTSAAPDTCAWT